MANKLFFALLLTQSVTTAISYSQEEDSSQAAQAPNDKKSIYNTQHFHIQDEDDSHPKIERSKDESTMTMQTQHGKIQVTCGVENVDFASQCQAEWERTKKNKDSEKNSKDKKESHSPTANIKISWSSDE